MTDLYSTTVLLTGATGFVAQYLWPALVREGYDVRCLTRDAEKARSRWPDHHWVEGDVSSPDSIGEALQGCKAAYYLVHGMSEGEPDFRRKEVEAARYFAAAAGEAGVERIIYLGGVAPRRRTSEHLLSRLEVGETLRSGPVVTLELRASMIVGYGSLSWLIVRDLAARLPMMVLPRWLRSRTQPVAIDDVIVALLRAINLPLRYSLWFDLPGPRILSGKELLSETSEMIGLRAPAMLEIPVLTPWLSSQWVRFVTRADWSVAKEVVVGLTEDLLAHDVEYWDLIGHSTRMDFREAAQRALEAEEGEPPIPGGWAAIERAVAVLNSRRKENVGSG